MWTANDLRSTPLQESSPGSHDYRPAPTIFPPTQASLDISPGNDMDTAPSAVVKPETLVPVNQFVHGTESSTSQSRTLSGMGQAIVTNNPILANAALKIGADLWGTKQDNSYVTASKASSCQPKSSVRYVEPPSPPAPQIAPSLLLKPGTSYSTQPLEVGSNLVDEMNLLRVPGSNPLLATLHDPKFRSILAPTKSKLRAKCRERFEEYSRERGSHEDEVSNARIPAESVADKDRHF
jgi:hypothetical protein